MDFFESLRSELITMVESVEPTTFQKITSGFYQLSNLEPVTDLDNSALVEESVLDAILDFLIDTPSIKRYTRSVKPSEESILFLIHMGIIYNQLMLLEKSLEYYQEALNQREQSLGLKHFFTAELYHKVGKLYEQGEAYSEALKYYKTALWIRKELSYVNNNLLVAESYSSIAVLYYHMQEYTIAKIYIDKTVDIREKLLPSEDNLLLNSYHNQKFIYKASQPKKDYLALWLKSLQESKV